MKKVKKILYPFITIAVPLLSIIFTSIWLSSIFTLIDYEGNGFMIKLSSLTLNHPRRVACIFLFVLQLFIIRKINKEKEYAPSDIYGNYPIWIYFIAWLFIGYKKVNLKLKPIPLQFQLLNSNVLECFDDTEYQKENYKYKISHNGNIKKTKEINLIIADTYPISLDKIPKTLKDNYTIAINRSEGEGIRTNSNELINIIAKEIQTTKKHCKIYNLFLSTPASVNKAIFQKVFQTGFRDNFTINIYQQDSNENFKFKEKPTKIKC